MSVSVGLAAVR